MEDKQIETWEAATRLFNIISDDKDVSLIFIVRGDKESGMLTVGSTRDMYEMLEQHVKPGTDVHKAMIAFFSDESFETIQNN